MNDVWQNIIMFLGNSLAFTIIKLTYIFTVEVIKQNKTQWKQKQFYYVRTTHSTCYSTMNFNGDFLSFAL